MTLKVKSYIRDSLNVEVAYVLKFKYKCLTLTSANCKDKCDRINAK